MKPFKRVLVLSAGVILILVGIAGLVLPVLPGWLFIFMGLSLIAPRFASRLRQRLFRRFLKSDVVYLEEWKKSGVQAGFTTRKFPLVLKKTDDMLDPLVQIEFIRLFSSSPVVPKHELRVPERLVLPRQTHSANVAVLSGAEAFKRAGWYPVDNTDGAVTDVSGLTLLVFSADCLPIFFRCGAWIGIAHAGWRGTRQRIAVEMVGKLCRESGLQADSVHVLFGPGISAKHYEVGPEFKDYFPRSVREKDSKLYFDLIGENESQLLRAGVKPRHISNHEICTYEESGSFYSFRREGAAAGRMVSFITKL